MTATAIAPEGPEGRSQQQRRGQGIEQYRTASRTMRRPARRKVVAGIEREKPSSDSILSKTTVAR